MFVTRKVSTILDLTIISQECEKYLSHWGVVTKHGEVNQRPRETKSFAKKPGKE